MTETILVGLDGSKESWRAFKFAIYEAKQKGLEKITVAHAESGDKLPDKYKSTREMLEEAKERGAEEGIEIETELLTKYSSPDTAIVKYAEENYINHIIVGSKGRTGIKRILLGSIAQGIVEKAHCPVTVFRGKFPY